MQKVAKRTAQAQRQAAKRANFQGRKAVKQSMWQTRGAIKQSNIEIKKQLADARISRREDWELGPLAPKRDLGFNGYGVINEQTRMSHEYNEQHILNPKLVEKRCAWAGGTKDLLLAVGDRVVILEGPSQGKLDRIDSIDTNTGTVKLKEFNKALFKSPMHPEPQAAALPISIDAVRLVHPITDPKTGVTKDSIIRQLKSAPADMQSVNMTYERFEYGKKRDRIIPGLNVVIPWPPTQAPELVTYDGDTPRDLVEDRSFYYNLISPPMPTTVIDELRNKYSRFRTRHEPWYIHKKEAEAAEKKSRHEMLLAMQTPGQDLGTHNKALKDGKGEPKLTDDMLEKLGQIIAESKAISLEDAGAEQVQAKTVESTKQS